MLISDIITEVISEVGGDTSDTTLAAKMLIFCKAALRRFPLFSRTKMLTDTSYATLAIGQHTISPLPSDFIREFFVYRKSSGSKIEIEKHPRFNSVVNTESSGAPLYYRIINNRLEFDKKADQDYTIYVDYFKEIDNVVTTDSWGLDTSALEVLKDGIKHIYYSDYVEDERKAAEKLGLFKAGLDELETKFIMQDHPSHISES